MALNVTSEAKHSQSANAIPVQVDLIPSQAVTGRLGNSVMVVVPAFAKGQQGDPKTVFGSVVGEEATRAPHMRGGIYKPGGVQADNSSQEEAPQKAGEAAQRKDNYSQETERNPMPFGNPKMELVFTQIGNKVEEILGVVVHGLPGENPAHVGPQAAIARRVWIAFLVRILMMDAMRGHPGDGTALECQSSADGQKIFHPLGGLVPAVREQAMVAHADAQASRDPPKNDGQSEGLPGEEKQRCDRADVKGQHERGRRPIDGFRK